MNDAMVHSQTVDSLEDLALEPIDGWHRRTLVAFSPPEDVSDEGASFVVMRERLPEGETLLTIVNRQLLELRRLPRLRIVAHVPVNLNGTHAVRLKYTWEGPNGTVQQSCTFVETKDDEGAPLLTQFTTTCTKDTAPTLQPMFEQMLSSIRFGRKKPVSEVVPVLDEDDEPTLPPIPIPGTRSERRPSSLPPAPIQSGLRPPPLPAQADGEPPFIPMPGSYKRR